MQRWRVHHVLILIFSAALLLKICELSPSAMIDQMDRVLGLSLRGGLCAFFLIHTWHALHAMQSLLDRMVRDAATTRTPRALIIGLYLVTAISMAVALVKL